VSCTQAYMSEYGSIAGVPVAIGGVLYFALVFAIAALAWRPASPAKERTPGYIFLLSLPAVLFIVYLGYAAYVVLQTFCILCAITYVSVLAITFISWRAASGRIGALPGRLGGDVMAALSNPVGLVVALVLVVAAVTGVAKFPREAKAAAAAPEAAPVVVTDAERAKLAEWWDVQPKEIVPVDGGGAKVVVVKFNDYQCPLCGLTYNAYKPVFQKQSKDVRFVVKHYPLEGECNPGAPGGTHRASCEAAAAVIMAKAKGTSEKLEDWLFSHLGPPMLTPDQVKQAARDVAGIQDFDAQYPEVLKQVRADAALGDQLKVNSTPTFFINGRRLPESIAAPYFDALLEIEIKRQ
jgi:protein-disulfide isomerase